MTSTVALSSATPYLQQCVDDLDPAAATPFQIKSTVWQVAAIATLVAYSVLAVSCVCAVAATAPIYIPIAGLAAALLLGPVDDVHRLFERWSEESHARAEQLTEINRQYQQISPLTPLQLTLNLQQKGIHLFHLPTELQNPANLHTLKPLVARHQFWEGQVRSLQAQAQSKLDMATRLTTENLDEEREFIYELRCHALELESQALEAKVKNAFISAVIRRPFFLGTSEDIGAFSKTSSQERVIGHAVNATSVNEFFTFKRSGFAALTADEVKQLTVADLGTRLIAAM